MVPPAQFIPRWADLTGFSWLDYTVFIGYLAMMVTVGVVECAITVLVGWLASLPFRRRRGLPAEHAE